MEQATRSTTTRPIAAQPITAAICTRGRGAALLPAVRSILASEHPAFTLLIVDQSPDATTADALASLLSDLRVRYVRSETTGLGCARNLALTHADTEVVAFTDDDCEVPANWLSVMAEVFAANPRVAVAFCNVQAGPYNPDEGFVPVYSRTEDFRAVTIPDKNLARGIGAGIAVRRPVLLQFGGFDSLLGAGGRFPSCEDGDAALRSLLFGWEVYETCQVAVIHHGFRTFAEGKALALRDWVGVGAAYAKPVRAGHGRVWQVVWYELWTWCLRPPLQELLRLRRPTGLGRLLGFVQGFVQGWLAPVDRDTLLFRASENQAVHKAKG